MLPIRTPSTLGGVLKGLCALTNQSSCVDAAALAAPDAFVGANGSDPKGSDPWGRLGVEVGPNAAAKGSLAELWNWLVEALIIKISSFHAQK